MNEKKDYIKSSGEFFSSLERNNYVSFLKEKV